MVNIKLVKSEVKLCDLCGNNVNNTYVLCTYDTEFNSWRGCLYICEDCLPELKEAMLKLGDIAESNIH